MWTHFEYWHGGNPYIATTNERFWHMLQKYYISQYERRMFYVHGPLDNNGPISYRDKKSILRNFAIDWQKMASELNYSYSDLAEWADFFAEYGKKYGLLSEFRENGIL